MPDKYAFQATDKQMNGEKEGQQPSVLFQRSASYNTENTLEMTERRHDTDHIVFNSRARDLAIIKDFESLKTMAGGDVCQTVVGDLHAAVELQHRQVVRDGRACTQASHAFVCDPTAVGHALHNTRDPFHGPYSTTAERTRTTTPLGIIPEIFCL